MGKKRPITEEERKEAAELGWAEWRSAAPPKLADLRLRLFLKAKRQPKFRFYALYDRICRLDVLRTAWSIVRTNRGAAGVDGVSIDQIVGSEDGPEELVQQLHTELRMKTYRPQPVRRVYIPKPDGRERPLGIPCIRDRVVQMAALLVLEAIFEADFLDCSYGFRPGRGAHEALTTIRAELKQGRTAVYDADLRGYFDSIPRDKLVAALRMRVTDGAVLKLIRLWLNAPVVDEREGGPPRRQRAGTPQGGVISPLLANIYLHWFDRFFHGPDGPARWANARLVRYADDFVVLAEFLGPRLTSWIERTLEQRMGLELNREKTQAVVLRRKGASLDFLGFTFRFDRDLKGRHFRYLNVFPSKKAMARMRDRVREMTRPQRCFVPLDAVIGELNRYLRGWSRYFAFGYPRVAFRQTNSFVRKRLTVHARRKSQRPFRPPGGRTYYQHFQRMGLMYL